MSELSDEDSFLQQMKDLQVFGTHFMLPMADLLQALILRVPQRLQRRQLKHLISCRVLLDAMVFEFTY